MVLDGPRVANKDANKGGTPAEVKLPGVTGGEDSTDKEEVVAPKPHPSVENTGAVLKNESNNGEATEMNRIMNGAVDSEGEAPPQTVNPGVKLATIIEGSEPIEPR